MCLSKEWSRARQEIMSLFFSPSLLSNAPMVYVIGLALSWAGFVTLRTVKDFCLHLATNYEGSRTRKCFICDVWQQEVWLGCVLAGGAHSDLTHENFASRYEIFESSCMSPRFVAANQPPWMIMASVSSRSDPYGS
jgi:hypothetical protein